MTEDFEQFTDAALVAGYDEVIVREWTPGLVLDEHTHPFALTARVVRGEMWLVCAGKTRHLVAGETFDLAAEVPHAERYGSDGATVWVARRHPAA